MNCFDLPNGLAQCIAVAKPWFELVVGLTGLGTFALAAVLIWIIKKVRAENEFATKAYNEALRDKQRAEDSLRDAHVERGSVEYQLKLCQSSMSGDMDGMARRLEAAMLENQKLEARFALVRQMTTDGDVGFWSRLPGRRCENYEVRLGNSIPIVIMAAQKGGVGKSTLTANLAACFADEGDRVLAVDMDYQGTMSAQMIRQADLRLGAEQSRVDQLLQETLPHRWYAEILQVNNNLHFLPAYYPLETLERREEYRWAMDDAEDDVRYRLARALLSDYVKETYKFVVIDAPPRMTLGFINGFCASTHLFVPTILDAPSAFAVGRFAQQFRRLVPGTNPFLQFAGIIGTMTNAGPVLPGVNTDIADLAESQAANELGEKGRLFIREAVMKRSAPLATAAEAGIAYYQHPATQPIFREIAKAIRQRLGRRTA
jgi:cellulose biosynthesis protein BcsQ